MGRPSVRNMTTSIKRLLLVALVLAIIASADWALRLASPAESTPAIVEGRARPPARTSEGVVVQTPTLLAQLPDASPIIARPLFAPERTTGQRPVDRTISLSAIHARDAMQSARLAGVAGRGAPEIALVEVGGAVHRIRPGETLHGWRLLQLEGGRAVFELNGARIELQTAR